MSSSRVLCLVAEVLEEGPQRAGEQLALLGVEPGEQPILGRDVVRERVVDEGATRLGELDEDASSVGVGG